MDSAESLFEFLIDFLSKSTLGIIILCIIGVGVISFPVIKFMVPLIKDHKKEKEEKRKEEEKEKQESKEFRDKISTIITHIPSLDASITSLTKDIEQLKSVSESYTLQASSLQTSIDTLANKVKNVSEESNEGDLRVATAVEQTQDMVRELSESVKSIRDNVDILIEGDTNEFRLYIMKRYTTFIHDQKPITRDDKQELRLKYEKYRKEGGNSWAEDMYNEILSLPIADSE